MTTKDLGKLEQTRNRFRKSKHYFTIVVVLLLICATVVSIFVLDTFHVKSSLFGKDSVVNSSPNSTLSKEDAVKENWWDDDFAFSAKLKVTNNNTFATLDKDSVVRFDFDHKDLVTRKNSLASGSDLELVYLQKNSTYKRIPFNFFNPNKEDSYIKFKTEEDIPANSSIEYYYLYYGDFTKLNSFDMKITASMATSSVSFSITNPKTLENPLNPILSRKWIIKGGDSVSDSYKKLEVTIEDIGSEISGPKVNILEFDKSLLKTYDLIHTKDYANTIDLSTLPPGTYYIQVEGDIQGKKRLSAKHPVIVSEPMYVNWSMDWEGFYLEDSYLWSIEEISNKFKVPVTHYFNPRIYSKKQDPKRAAYLTDWIKKRQKDNGDEIQLHLHMWFDMVEEAGVPVKKDVFWEKGLEGHDVPQTVYSPEEFDKMIKWGLQKFQEHNLPKPIGYRAGGWQINSAQLKVLEKNGFEFDSSGRDYTQFGAKKMEVPWRLTPTSQPYVPSTTNINIAGTGTDAMNLWEFPNNGDNSSNYGQKSTKILDNFYKNYKGTFLTERETFIILSHVQLFYNDAPVVKRFFEDVSQKTAEQDSGPVIFSTIEKILPEYQED
jgi:peptidoglycan/xylan/chitin deacetylase (PgdA/CDA1 family)